MLNNLALTLTMEGKAEQAEGLLKQAVAHGGHEARINHNLTLVLSLQGKYEEAKLLGARQASANGKCGLCEAHGPTRAQTIAGGPCGAEGAGQQRCRRRRAGAWRRRGGGGHLGLGHARGPGNAGCLMRPKVNRSWRLPAASAG
jgi:hypothetical protein